jgi:acyl-coenzyme A thioesterase PaaI-like protein
LENALAAHFAVPVFQPSRWQAMTAPDVGFTCAPDPENPGWMRWQLNDPTRYNEAVLGRMIARTEGPDHCRVRIFPQQHLTNNAGNIHGAATLGLIDIALFCAMQLLRGSLASGSVTLGLDTQFIGAGDGAKSLDCVVEVLRETRRLGFLRGLVEQEGNLVAAFSGTIRKAASR